MRTVPIAAGNAGSLWWTEGMFAVDTLKSVKERIDEFLLNLRFVKVAASVCKTVLRVAVCVCVCVCVCD